MCLIVPESAKIEDAPAPLDLCGKRVMVTAGPTREPIDPVRFISNRSSGKMGYAIARQAAQSGANVILISGPVSIPAPEGVKVIYVTTAAEMMDAAARAFPDHDIAIFAAAVCDVRPKRPSQQKIKKPDLQDAFRSMELVENPDILLTLAAQKKPGQVVVGFAAETDALIDNARDKLVQKGADIIVANDVSDGRAFGLDAEVAHIITREQVVSLPMLDKSDIAKKLLYACLERCAVND